MRVRPPAVAGSFYPSDADVLAADVDGYLAAGRATLAVGAEPPAAVAAKAVIAPHAGYIYSGPIAGTAYALVRERCAGIERVVLLGPAHRVRLQGLAASSADAFATPLGNVPVDRAAVEALLHQGAVQVMDAAHAAEHSLEVQLPFLQRILGRFALVPLAAGAATAEEVAAILEALWDGPGTLLVISSDLSHYHEYATARRLDAVTCEAIEALDPERLDYESACGRVPVSGLLLSARRHGLRAHLLDRRNSGDTAGPRDEVVGYASFAFLAAASPPNTP